MQKKRIYYISAVAVLFVLLLSISAFAFSLFRLTGFTVAMPSCPDYGNIDETRAQCEQSSGTFSTTVDENGCEQPSCQLPVQQTQDTQINIPEPEEVQQCPAVDLALAKNQCESEGNTFSTQNIEDCTYPVCNPATVTCSSSQELEMQKASCQNTGGKPYFVYDNNNCAFVECRLTEMLDEAVYGGKNPMCSQIETAQIEKMKMDCTSRGGKFTLKTSNNCQYPNCDFAQQSSFFGCPQVNREEISSKCQALGLPVSVEVRGGCEVPTCRNELTECPGPPSNIGNCESEGMVLVTELTPNGCMSYKCVPPGSVALSCQKEPPAEFISECKSKGGNMYVKKDGSGCMVEAQCTAYEDVIYQEITPDEVSLSEALELAFKLEEIEIKFDEAAEKCTSLAEYYEGRDENKRETFLKCASIFRSSKQPLQEIRNLLKTDPLTTEALTNAKIQIKQLKNILKDVLDLLLGQGEGTTTEVYTVAAGGDCGSDSTCFEKCLRTCNECNFNPYPGLNAEIEGLTDDGKCRMNAESSTEEAASKFGQAMECEITNFAAGLTPDMFNECSGPIAEMMRSQSGGYSG